MFHKFHRHTEIEAFRDMFNTMDEDASGEIDANELAEALRQRGEVTLVLFLSPKHFAL